MEAAGDEQGIARNNFDLCVATNQYWAVVDAQSDLKGWIEEYWDPDHSVALSDNIIFGKVEIQVRKVKEIEWEEEGAGDETEFNTFIGEENRSNNLKRFMKDLLAFTEPLAKSRKVGMNIYHLKEASDGVFHLFMGD